MPLHPAPLRLYPPDRAAAAAQEDPAVPHLQEHPRPPQDLLLFGGRRLVKVDWVEGEGGGGKKEEPGGTRKSEKERGKKRDANTMQQLILSE